jgi:hypothetical protein
MTAYYIQLSEGVRLSARQYLAALRLAMANPAASFRQSFNDPRGWMGGHTGASIVAEWRAMLRDRWAALFTASAARSGKGNRARKRADALRRCKWCGQQVGREFCDGECRRAYYGG